MFPSICSPSMHQKLLTLNAICTYSCTDTCIVQVCRSLLPLMMSMSVKKRVLNKTEQNGKYPSIVLSKLKRSDCSSQTEKVGPLPKRSPKGPILGRLLSKWIHSPFQAFSGPSSEIYKFLAPGFPAQIQATQPSRKEPSRKGLIQMMPWARTGPALWGWFRLPHNPHIVSGCLWFVQALQVCRNQAGFCYHHTWELCDPFCGRSSSPQKQLGVRVSPDVGRIPQGCLQQSLGQSWWPPHWQWCFGEYQGLPVLILGLPFQFCRAQRKPSIRSPWIPNTMDLIPAPRMQSSLPGWHETLLGSGILVYFTYLGD